jgi:hypothetical protein
MHAEREMKYRELIYVSAPGPSLWKEKNITLFCHRRWVVTDYSLCSNKDCSAVRIKPSESILFTLLTPTLHKFYNLMQFL